MATNNHPANGPLSLERLHQIRGTLSKAAAQSDGGNLGYTMADAVKMIDETIIARNMKPVAWTDEEELRDARKGYSAYLFAIDGDANKFAAPRSQIMLYVSPPAPENPNGWVIVPVKAILATAFKQEVK